MTTLLKDDFYDYVNGEWLETAVIPADKPATGGFQDLVDGIDSLMIAEFENMAHDPHATPKGRMKDAVAFYRLASDFAQREAAGATEANALLAKIEALRSYEELNQQLASFVLEGIALPFQLDVDADMKNAQMNTLSVYPPATILPDKTYYTENPQASEMLQVYFEMAVNVLVAYGKDQAEAESLVEQAIAFDKLIAPHVRSAEESADYSKNYNPRSLEEFAKQASKIDFRQLLTALLPGTPEELIVTEPAYFEAFDIIVSDSHFELLKGWMIVNQSLRYTSYLSEELRQLGGTYSRYLSGIDEAAPQQKAAYYLTMGHFSQVIGDYYGRKYFGETAKKDVKHMVETMIAVYQDRLRNNTWLSEETRQKAIIKLNRLGIHVGYPDQVPAIYDQLHTDEEKSLLANALHFNRLFREDAFKKWQQPVDREEWEMSAATVNAYYHPFKNVIVFPAAILQAPFYSLEQSTSANYGGIGAVIAHEISHAFDNNGAKFDEYGNLNNWWTEEDLAHFERLAQAMIDEFDGLPFAGGTVNGTLTVSENIADAGGLSCALEAAQKESDVSLADFFTNWAKIWRTKAKEQYQQLLLSIDVHGPAKLRANIQVQNIDEFYTTFDIKPGDPMYRAPEDRVQIW
ncbi:M13 family peptidase [Enterococcus casseliflavus]|uniref:M13 family metallopeptidase n=1 Tax=Enterococcus casseliflavus TaxID=37734 RepID=UPI001433084D|nr:M13-type metalloendopeptidase [Enterococcus casseliflavus]NKD30398.1 M13 family peptidase [Enterococcus casseliflavus]